MVVKNYIINKGHYNNFKRAIDFLNDNYIYYWFAFRPDKEINIMNNLNFNECKNLTKII